LSGLTDFASIFGIPAVAASIAGSIYWALSKAEKVARPEALREISAVLKDRSWSQSVKPWSIVERLFVWTFGEKHFSLKCISRSAISTVIMVTSILTFEIALQERASTGTIVYLAEAHPYPILLFLVLVGFTPDYVALLKTRVLLKKKRKYPAILLLCFDAVSSIAISYVFFALATATQLGEINLDFYFNKSNVFITPGGPPYIFVAMESVFYIAFFCSTMFTSVWLALVVLSTALIKFLAPLQRFTTWFFDVEKHPLQAVGIVTAALVMLSAAIGAVFQKL
jgi:hypothetical protein